VLTKKPGKKTAWIIVGVACAMVLGCAGVVYLDVKKMGEEKEASEGLKSQIAKADARLRAIPDLELRVLRERTRVKEQVKILPDDNDINNFVDKISEFAKTSGVEIESLDDKSAKTRQARKATETFVRIIYKLAARGTFAQFVDFVNRFETHDRFVSVNSFTVKSDSKSGVKKDGGADAPAQHSVDVEIETYVYNANQGPEKPPVDIQNADQKLAKILRTEPVQGVLALDRYAYVAHPERRDPFADPRREEGQKVEVKSEENSEADAKLLAELTEELKKVTDAVGNESGIADLVTRIEYSKRLNSQIAAFKDKVADVRKNEKAFTTKDARSAFASRVEQPLLKLLGSRTATTPDIMAQEIESQYVKMAAAFEQKRHAEVLAAAKTLLDTRPGEADAVLAKLFDKVAILAHRAEARHEFEQKTLKFSGLVFKPSDPQKAVIIINDKAYAAGDVMDDGVVVRSIDPGKVVFLYKREEIVASMD
jgi:Tfp pilus assembly protein PilO